MESSLIHYMYLVRLMQVQQASSPWANAVQSVSLYLEELILILELTRLLFTFITTVS